MVWSSLKRRKKLDSVLWNKVGVLAHAVQHKMAVGGYTWRVNQISYKLMKVKKVYKDWLGK